MIINFNISNYSAFTVESFLNIATDIYSGMQVVEYFSDTEKELRGNIYEIISDAIQFVKAAIECERIAKNNFEIIRNYDGVNQINDIINTYNSLVKDELLVENPITKEDLEREIQRWKDEDAKHRAIPDDDIFI